ncbi:MAG TPA: PilZ domain-containing protein [Syntrophales bacterium]|nr:PilZ domain-containing protein [Syntrophales bacterium]HQB29560.1 PilZ domain-containing protein [Syntrophales bacterium]
MENIVKLRDGLKQITESKETDTLCLPPCVFKHHDLVASLEAAQKVDLKKLINIINLLHFNESCAWVYLVHIQYEEGILVKTSLKPCTGRELTCLWADDVMSKLNLSDFHFQYIVVSDGQSVIFIPGRLLNIDSSGISVSLPDFSFNVSRRKHRRYGCEGLDVDILQHGLSMKGILVDYSAVAFCVRIFPESDSIFTGFNADAPATVNIRKGDKTLFSSPCRHIRHASDVFGRELVFSPEDNKIERFRKAKIRSPRYRLTPPPSIVFRHPLFDATIQREVHDISNSGLSVLEKNEESVLMPGLILPELTIQFSGSTQVRCKAQVIYRKETENGEKILCGLAIVDMNMRDYGTLNQVLSHSKDHFSNVSSFVDMNALWEFFFDSNFIYPEKYQHIHGQKNEYKNTYTKLYQNNPEIAKHFTYEADGRIYGHIAMVRAYDHAWMIHHYAARAMENRLVGFVILREILKYINGAHRLPSASMSYMMTYYRAGNKIVGRLFGGYAEHLNRPSGCSTDPFAYTVYRRDPEADVLPRNWELAPATGIDLWQADNFYKHHSNGLLFDALGLGKETKGAASLESIYHSQGFRRKWHSFSLTCGKKLAALIIVEESDLGFNLSNLLNGFKIIVVDPQRVRWDILTAAMDQLSPFFSTEETPVLVFPYEYMERNDYPVEKQYNLWILDVAAHGNHFLEYMEKHYRIRMD